MTNTRRYRNIQKKGIYNVQKEKPEPKYYIPLIDKKWCSDESNEETYFPDNDANFNFGRTKLYREDDAIVFTKYITNNELKIDINKFDHKSREVGLKYVKEMNDWNIFQPIHWNELTKQKKKSQMRV